MGSCSTEQCATACHKGASCGADDYNWCAVPHRPWDTLLFAGIAVVIACLSQGPYSSLIVLVAGEPCMKEQSTLHKEALQHDHGHHVLEFCSLARVCARE